MSKNEDCHPHPPCNLQITRCTSVVTVYGVPTFAYPLVQVLVQVHTPSLMRDQCWMWQVGLDKKCYSSMEVSWSFLLIVPLPPPHALGLSPVFNSADRVYVCSAVEFTKLSLHSCIFLFGLTHILYNIILLHPRCSHRDPPFISC